MLCYTGKKCSRNLQALFRDYLERQAIVMEDKIYISPEDIEILDAGEYSTDLSEHFETVPDVAKP